MMTAWVDNTGFWEDDAPSWTMSDGEFYAHIRQEGQGHCVICGLDKAANHHDFPAGSVRLPHEYIDYGNYWWRVHNTADHSHVDSGMAPSLDSAKRHVSDRIRWTREARQRERT